ncbi:protein lethal(2)essential for life [Anabrus simplex]|uniref:protein lethal(2)essential for life n=1 Tax=Anabrus simplex TaxID=316456 RepID=UPI0035A2671A
MSVLPLMVPGWWDDFDRPSRLLDQHFGMGLHHDDLLSSYPISPFLRSTGYVRPWRHLNRQLSGTANVTHDKDKFQVILDVQQFTPNEITVKTSNHHVIVEGKHEEKKDEHGYISRHFVRRYSLPKDVDESDVVSNLSSDGVLTITAPKKTQLPAGERVVPVIHTGVPAVKVAVPAEPQATPASPIVEQPKEGK